MENSQLVAQHYNQVEQKSVRERQNSSIIELRRFNNAMKSLLLYQAFKYVEQSALIKEPLRILDLGCGKGGDLPKYFKSNNVELVVGVDIAPVSIEQCKERYRSYRRTRPKGVFFVADLTKVDIRPKLIELDCTKPFHVASAQFNIHYSFESYEQVFKYISNAVNNLAKLGIFIGTYPDGPKLIKLARSSETQGLYKIDDILSVEFTQEDLTNPETFGTKYHFKLKEVVDCPEFLVHPKILKSMMKSLGFHEIFDRSFEEHIRKALSSAAYRDKFKEIFEVHHALDFSEPGKGRLNESMWGVASLYRCFCYRKL